MSVVSKWVLSADKARGQTNTQSLRFCPGVYLPTGEFFDVWLRCWLETTPYSTFEELWASNRVAFYVGKRGFNSEDSRVKKSY